MVIICPYCDIEISEKLVEAEDGCCPECGTSITARNVIEEPEEDIYAKEFEDDVDDDGYEPDFEDEFDMDDDELLSDPYEDVEFQKPRRLNREWEEMQEEPAEDALAIAAGVKTASSREKEAQEKAAAAPETAEKKKSPAKAVKKETKSTAKKEEAKKAAKTAKTAKTAKKK